MKQYFEHIRTRILVSTQSDLGMPRLIYLSFLWPCFEVWICTTIYKLISQKTRDSFYSIIYTFQIEDLVGGGTDLFCGDRSPFMWESRGSRVRLVYSQVGAEFGFSANYSMLNI